MNKTEFVEMVADRGDLTKKESKLVVDVVLDTLEECLVSGKDVNLTPVGKFEIVTRAPRKGRNPQTGEELNIPERNAVKFKASKTLKEGVN